jgi:phospholipase/carboxylesterase
MYVVLGLHGSSGHPANIQNFVDRLAPDAPSWCPRGTFADGDGFTFFKRNPDFSIPAEELLHLAERSLLPCGFVSGIAGEKILAVGYSSGAIFATAQISVAPQMFVGALLLRPQPLAEDFAFPDLSGKPILILSGLEDNRRQPHHAKQLARQLRDAQANVTHHELKAGHGWASDDLDLTLARKWMMENL